jgi:hypothetical protein
MQGLSPEHPEASQPLQTTTPEDTPEDSPRPGEIPLVTLPHMDISDVPKVFTPPPLELKTILLLKRRLMTYLPIWYSLLHPIHLPLVLFISKYQVLIQFYDRPKVSLRSQHSILMLGQPRTIALSKIWPKHPQRCLPSKFSSLVPHSGELC